MTQLISTAFHDDSDASLVMHALGGNRDAFCTIVLRYQNLLCSVAYSAIGDLKRSEDLAQEAFIEAWKKLDSLKEPERLKAWLCGILRFKISHFRRHESSQATHQADDIEAAQGSIDSAESIEEDAINTQHESLMWQVLQEMDAAYREPLVLFYREQQSIATVAAELDLTEDTVKQRLSRGRKLLKQAMVSIVETGLEKSKPGIAFTTAVMLSINSISPPAKAAALGFGAVKGSSAFTAATSLATLASLSGLVSAFFGLRAGLDQSRTEREKRLVKRSVVAFLLVALLYSVLMIGTQYVTYANPELALWFTTFAHTVVVVFVLAYLVMTRLMLTAMSALRKQERMLHPHKFLGSYDQQPEASEYVSSWRLLGVPLCHFQFGIPEANYRPAFGWIACGSKAYGLIVAWGGLAVAPISIGIIAYGGLSIGAVSFGILGLGTVAIGVVAFGSAAIGWLSYSSLLSSGWAGAVSGAFALSPRAAVGSIAFANEVNNAKAELATHLALFQNTYLSVLLFIAVVVIVPSISYAVIVRRRMRVQSGKGL